MPRRQSRRKSKRRRKSAMKNPRNQVVSMRTGIASRSIVKLRYCSTETLNPGVAGTVANHVYSANGLFDPNITGTGHQPMGFDQWMAFYNHYHVIGSKITVNFVSKGTTTVDENTYIVGVKVAPSTTLETSLSTVCENARTVFKPLTNSNAKGQTTVVRKFSAKKFFGRPSIISEDEFKGGTGTNPPEQAYFHIFAAPFDGTEDASPLEIFVTLEYIAILTEPIQLGAS